MGFGFELKLCESNNGVVCDVAAERSKDLAAETIVLLAIRRS